MKKIKNTDELKTKRKKLLQRQQELEKEINYELVYLKKNLNPLNMAENMLSDLFNKKEKKNHR